MSDAVAVFIDKHGTPSVIGPFDTLDDAAEYAKTVTGNFEDDSINAKIANINPPEHNWKEQLDGSN